MTEIDFDPSIIGFIHQLLFRTQTCPPFSGSCARPGMGVYPCNTQNLGVGKFSRCALLLISLCKDPGQELSLRRALITLCAMLQDGRIPVETKVEIGTNWVDVVKHNYQADDMMVCFAEQRAGLLQKPLSQILESNLSIPVYVVSGVHLPTPRSNWLADVTAWLGSIGMIAGFGLLQVKIMQVSADWFQTLLLILVVISEIWLIWVWDRHFR